MTAIAMLNNYPTQELSIRFESIYSDRIAGRHRHHRDSGGDVVAGVGQGESGRKKACCINNLHQMGLSLIMYAHDNSDFLARANAPYWFEVAALNMGGRAGTDFVHMQNFRCPAYCKPGQANLINDDVNGWWFTSPTDATGSQSDEVAHPSRISAALHPQSTIYLADDEYNSSRAFTTIGSPFIDTTTSGRYPSFRIPEARRLRRAMR